MRDKLEFAGWWIWVLLLVIVAGAAFLFLSPYAQNRYTKQVRGTIQYTDSKVSVLLDNMKEYNALETKKALYKNDPDVVKGMEAQQAAILASMKKEAARLESEHIPSEVAQFLASH